MKAKLEIYMLGYLYKGENEQYAKLIEPPKDTVKNKTIN